MTLQLTPVQVLAVVGALLVLIGVWRASARASRKAAETARTGARLVSLTGRVVATAGVIVLGQWLVITQGGSSTALFTVLGIPAALAAYTLTKALTVTTPEPPHHRSRKR
ncbi:hypothetical protein LCD36_05480 [Saccharopolyspora sp. 6T]|uniref:hypothetical protein n=1 Tax=Saccharopolyspora sp. 6T TaxID=2877238 RepID=UPI001CD312B0|nr:hypothetical protein [Saccharopolyspora sp. 6T]MCA1185900.1 hypothetical protein [Saccharopolyspora sp. 6T]